MIVTLTFEVTILVAKIEELKHIIKVSYDDIGNYFQGTSIERRGLS